MTSHATADRRVLGRYVLGPALGRGATSVVHRARDVVSGEEVAVKVVPVELDLAPRVRAEVRAAGRLDHPRIVALRDWGEDRESLYLVWELVEGPSLAEVLRGPGAAGGTVLRVGEDVLSALAHAHARGVVHRDVKPANILIGPDGRARLSDFGVARLSGESGLTMTGSVVGTVAYMSPEQALGHGAGPESDVYSACLVLYEALTGSNPVSAANPAETARRAASGAVPPLARARPDLPSSVARLVDAGLHLDPARRPTAGALADELGALRGGVRAARRRGVRALPALASAAGGAALAAVAVREAPASSSVDWTSPPVALAAMAVAGLAFAWRPRAAALIAVVAGSALVGRTAPGAAAVLAAIALLILTSGWRFGRLTLLAAAGPALFALGLAPLVPAIAGLARRWPARLWAGCAAVAATLAWQVAAGTDSLLAGGGFAPPGVSDLRDERSPDVAARALWEPLSGHPGLAVQAAALVGAALVVPLVLRAREGAPRVIAATLWTAVLSVALVASAHDVASALGAVIPGGVVVVGWSLSPWRALRRRPAGRASATLRGPIV